PQAHTLPSHHCSRANKGIPPNHRTTDNGGIGANGRPASHQGARILIVTHDLCTWGNDVCKDTRRSTEDIIFEFHPRVDRDVILNLDVIAQHHVRSHMHVLAQNTALPNARPGHHMAKMPDLRPSTNTT